MLATVLQVSCLNIAAVTRINTFLSLVKLLAGQLQWKNTEIFLVVVVAFFHGIILCFKAVVGMKSEKDTAVFALLVTLMRNVSSGCKNKLSNEVGSLEFS